MITADQVRSLIVRLNEQGYGDDIVWSERVTAPADPEAFAWEAIYVICNSGMQHKIARAIYERVQKAVLEGKSAFEAFKHPGKTAAIDRIWAERSRMFEAFNAAPNKVDYCASLPWIGEITKFHLAKNFGADVAKPDVHLQRLADREGVTAQVLCERLARETGYRIATVDLILWRACAVGLINSREIAA